MKIIAGIVGKDKQELLDNLCELVHIIASDIANNVELRGRGNGNYEYTQYFCSSKLTIKDINKIRQ